MLQIPGLFISSSGERGRGVFTAVSISPEDVIEICPVIFIPKQEVDLIHKTVLHDYYFIWPDEEAGACIALGFGSLYNHSKQPNAAVRFDLGAMTMTILCVKDIGQGDEITIDYQGGLKDAPDLWFR